MFSKSLLIKFSDVKCRDDKDREYFTNRIQNCTPTLNNQVKLQNPVSSTKVYNLCWSYFKDFVT